MPSRKQREDFAIFLDWCRFYDLKMPVGGDQVAAYLLEMMADGATLPNIQRAAESVIACYRQHRTFLDELPIKAALALAAAQLDSRRTLH